MPSCTTMSVAMPVVNAESLPRNPRRHPDCISRARRARLDAQLLSRLDGFFRCQSELESPMPGTCCILTVGVVRRTLAELLKDCALKVSLKGSSPAPRTCTESGWNVNS